MVRLVERMLEWGAESGELNAEGKLVQLRLAEIVENMEFLENTDVG